MTWDTSRFPPYTAAVPAAVAEKTPSRATAALAENRAGDFSPLSWDRYRPNNVFLLDRVWEFPLDVRQIASAPCLDPTTAQFLTIDPMVAQTMSQYAYTAGDPINAMDPSGAWQHLATSYLAVKDIIQVPLTSLWFTVGWNSSGSRITQIGTTTLALGHHDPGFTFGTWNVVGSNVSEWISGGCTRCITAAVSAQVGFSETSGLIQRIGNWYNTLRLTMVIRANGTWTYSVDHWIRSDLAFGYSWAAWSGGVQNASWWDGPPAYITPIIARSF